MVPEMCKTEIEHAALKEVTLGPFPWEFKIQVVNERDAQSMRYSDLATLKIPTFETESKYFKDSDGKISAAP